MYNVGRKLESGWVLPSREAKDADGKTPLHYAYEYGHIPIANYLISVGARQKVKDNNGKTPFDLAKK